MARLRILSRSLSTPISITQVGPQSSVAAESAMRAAEFTSAYAQQVRQINLDLQGAKDNNAFQALADGDPGSFIPYVQDRLSHTDRSSPDYATLNNMLTRSRDKLEELNWQTDIKSGDKTYEDFLAHLKDKMGSESPGSSAAAALLQQISQTKQAIMARDQATSDQKAQLSYIQNGDNNKYRDYLIQRLGKTSDAKTQTDIITQIKNIEARQTQQEAAQRAAAVNDVIVGYREGKYSAAEAAQRLQAASHDPKATESEVNHIQTVVDAIFNHASSASGAAGKSAYEQSVQTFSDAKASYDDAIKNPSAYSVDQWNRILDNVYAAGQAVSDQGKAYAKQTGNAAIARQSSQVDEFIGGNGVPGTAVLAADTARFKAVSDKVIPDTKNVFQMVKNYTDHASEIRAFTALVPGDQADRAKGGAINLDLSKAHIVLTDAAKAQTDAELKAIGVYHNAQDKYNIAMKDSYDKYAAAVTAYNQRQGGLFGHPVKQLSPEEYVTAAQSGDAKGDIAKAFGGQAVSFSKTDDLQNRMQDAKVDADESHTDVTGAGITGTPENMRYASELVGAAKLFAPFIPASSTMGTPQTNSQWWDFANGRTPSGGFYDENIDQRQNFAPAQPGISQGPKPSTNSLSEDLTSLYMSPGMFNQHMFNTGQDNIDTSGDKNSESQQIPPMVGMGSEQRNQLFGASDSFAAANAYLNEPTPIDLHGFGLPDLIDMGPTYDQGNTSMLTDPNIGTGINAQMPSGGSGMFNLQ